ncbi:hypothetical protein O4H61_05600 [Roseovarius aestuarii]|nr:hypothetical protein [Roseovarius aestuarii]
MATFTLKFFFDYGAGGCLWAGDDYTRDQLGFGPLDTSTFDLQGKVRRKPTLSLSSATHAIIEELDFQHSGYLNPKYPPDPSLWTQALCDDFNEGVERLLSLLKSELGTDFRIVDKQYRYVEDAELTEYLKANPELSAMNSVTKPSVR